MAVSLLMHMAALLPCACASASTGLAHGATFRLSDHPPVVCGVRVVCAVRVLCACCVLHGACGMAAARPEPAIQRALENRLLYRDDEILSCIFNHKIQKKKVNTEKIASVKDFCLEIVSICAAN